MIVRKVGTNAIKRANSCCSSDGQNGGGGLESVVMNYCRHIDHSRVQFDFIVDEDSTIVPYKEIESLGGHVFVVPPYQYPFAYQRALVSFLCSKVEDCS